MFCVAALVERLPPLAALVTSFPDALGFEEAEVEAVTAGHAEPPPPNIVGTVERVFSVDVGGGPLCGSRTLLAYDENRIGVVGKMRRPLLSEHAAHRQISCGNVEMSTKGTTVFYRQACMFVHFWNCKTSFTVTGNSMG